MFLLVGLSYLSKSIPRQSMFLFLSNFVSTFLGCIISNNFLPMTFFRFHHFYECVFVPWTQIIILVFIPISKKICNSFFYL